WVDEHSGVIRYLGLDPPHEVGPDLPIGSTAVLANYTEGVHVGHDPMVGSGKGLTTAKSLVSAIGEARQADPGPAGRRPSPAMDARDPRRLALRVPGGNVSLSYVLS